ncbi:Hypothetical predicted protein [Lecanosticta acicola]|uniref:Uncharacterized protein n=1 Tax=Lecanosticta acicola TaxID=111012 RepID=A0AAI8Z8D5_9PEZI|nr:Hypothetical predicted protein [Lecanosticta acicola]
MRGGGAFAGVALATICGVATAYTTLQPAFQQQKEEREGTFSEKHRRPADQENAISRAIASDFKEAKAEVEKSYGGTRGNGGVAWGIRQALFGKEPDGRTQKDQTPQENTTENAAKEPGDKS